jgi:hypothetical protein
MKEQCNLDTASNSYKKYSFASVYGKSNLPSISKRTNMSVSSTNNTEILPFDHTIFTSQETERDILDD